MVGAHARRLKSARFHSLNSAVSPRIPILLFWVLVLSEISGCAVSAILPIDASAPIELAPNEALLIVHIDTDVALESLILNNRPVARSLGKGRHVWMVRVPEGSYRWKRVEIGSGRRRNPWFELESDEELRFEVKAGKINYPGELAIRSGPLSWGDNGTLIVRNRNHSAMAVRELRGPYDAVLRSFPLHYAGLSGDGFLEYYMRKRERPAAESSGAAHRDGRVDLQSEAP
jgi:hypothetical protein